VSERVGGAHKKKRVTLRISEDANEKLVNRAQITKLKKKMIVETLIDLDVQYKLTSPGWETRLNEALDIVRRDRFKNLDTACPALNFSENKWVCVWARQGKTPQTKVLGVTEEGADAICQACGKTMKLITEYEGQLDKMKAQMRRGAVFEIPQCLDGGILNDDGIHIYCKRSTTKIKVTKCKTMRKGAPCQYLKWINIGVKGKFSEETNQ
jgi:uncharacterized protein (DUF4415 family)